MPTFNIVLSGRVEVFHHADPVALVVEVHHHVGPVTVTHLTPELSPDDQAALDALKAQSKDLATAANTAPQKPADTS